MTPRSNIAAFALLVAGACTPPNVLSGNPFFLCSSNPDVYCAPNQPPADAGSDAGIDAGHDAGPLDAGFDAGFDAGPPSFNCADGDAGGCVICSADLVDGLPDLLYPRWGLGGVYIKQTNGSEVFDRIYAVGGFDPSGATTADVEVDELDTGNTWGQVGNANLSPRTFFPVVSQPAVGLIAVGGEDLDTGAILGDTVIFSNEMAPIPSFQLDRVVGTADTGPGEPRRGGRGRRPNCHHLWGLGPGRAADHLRDAQPQQRPGRRLAVRASHEL